MKQNTSIVYLWSILTGYVNGVLLELREITSGTIDVIHWDKKNINDSKYEIEFTDNDIKFHKRSKFSENQIIELLIKQHPDIIVVSGWMDKGYLSSLVKYKQINSSVKVVCGIDDLWSGTIRQKIGRIYFQIFYKKIFDFMWVSGKPQFSYAQKFGYNIDNIISNLYSADNKLFKLSNTVSKRFIFVGRFVKFKAIELLVEAYCQLPNDLQNEWPLVLIGDGDQKELIITKKNKNIQLIPFLQPADLRNELVKGGVACLPSHKEHWGVVVHEFCLIGMPIILSSGVGSSTEFLISGYNGFIFEKGNVNSLSCQLYKFTKMSELELSNYAQNSRKLGNRINNEISAYSLLSII